RAALARQRDARWRRRQDEARLLIAGIVQGIEPARNEGIVQRADREQALAIDGVRQPKRGQQDEQIHLGDAELDVLACRGEIPIVGRRYPLALEQVAKFFARKKPAAVDPRAEIGRDRNVWRRGDDALDEIGLAAAELVQKRAKTCLRRHGWL